MNDRAWGDRSQGTGGLPSGGKVTDTWARGLSEERFPPVPAQLREEDDHDPEVLRAALCGSDLEA